MIINACTCLYGVLGYPVSHSLSPLMHNCAFSHIGWNGAYLAFEVKDIGSAITGIKALGIKGVSVTIPHKIAIMEFLDDLDDMAKNIGAVNTVANNQGTLTGYNSDGLEPWLLCLKKRASVKRMWRLSEQAGQHEQ